MITLYERLMEAECEIDHHESDLYVVATPKAREIVSQYAKEVGHAVFDSYIGADGRTWLDCWFLYEPWWERRVRK